MFLDSMKGASRKSLESTCEELSANVKKQAQELKLKEKQIERLSKNIRKWTRKYNELELSISETVIDSLNSDADSQAREEETKHLQLMLIKLNRKNAKLEQRLEKMTALLEKATTPANAESLHSSAAKDQAAPSIDSTDEDFEPEFAPEFQKVLNYYADTTPSE